MDRTRTKRLPNGTLLHVHTHGEQKPHKHKYVVNKDRTRRACECGSSQVKKSGRWTDERK